MAVEFEAAVGAVRKTGETATDICGCSGSGAEVKMKTREGSGDRLAFIASFLEQGFGFGTSLRVGLAFSMTCGV